MAEPFPAELSNILGASDPSERETAWVAFVQAYSRLLLHVARKVGRDYDSAMDAYAYVLEQLRADDCHRLRAYTADGRGKFTTWLVVVARRLCFDHYRRRYGRARGDSTAHPDVLAGRRRLEDLLPERLDPAVVADGTTPAPDAAVMTAERSTTLGAILARLDARDSLLLKLRFEDGCSARAIAGLMAFPTPFHVYRRLDALFDQLRAELRKRGVESPTT